MQYLNTSSATYMLLAPLFEEYGNELQWRIDEYGDITVKWERVISEKPLNIITQRMVLSKESLLKMSPEFYDLVVDDCKNSDTPVVVSSWKYWHETGIFLNKKEELAMYMNYSHQASR